MIQSCVLQCILGKHRMSSFKIKCWFNVKHIVVAAVVCVCSS